MFICSKLDLDLYCFDGFISLFYNLDEIIYLFIDQPNFYSNFHPDVVIPLRGFIELSAINNSTYTSLHFIKSQGHLNFIFISAKFPQWIIISTANPAEPSRMLDEGGTFELFSIKNPYFS